MSAAASAPGGPSLLPAQRPTDVLAHPPAPGSPRQCPGCDLLLSPACTRSIGCRTASAHAVMNVCMDLNICQVRRRSHCQGTKRLGRSTLRQGGSETQTQHKHALAGCRPSRPVWGAPAVTLLMVLRERRAWSFGSLGARAAMALRAATRTPAFVVARHSWLMRGTMSDSTTDRSEHSDTLGTRFSISSWHRGSPAMSDAHTLVM